MQTDQAEPTETVGQVKQRRKRGRRSKQDVCYEPVPERPEERFEQDKQRIDEVYEQTTQKVARTLNEAYVVGECLRRHMRKMVDEAGGITNSSYDIIRAEEMLKAISTAYHSLMDCKHKRQKQQRDYTHHADTLYRARRWRFHGFNNEYSDFLSCEPGKGPTVNMD